MPDAIPHEALARAVRAAFGARIVGAQPLFGDASSRRYVRLHLAGGGAPPTAVAMLLGADRFPLGSDEIGERALTKDLPFVDVGRYLAARGFAVPLIHHGASRPTSAPGCSPRWRRSPSPSSSERLSSSIATSWPGTSTCRTAGSACSTFRTRCSDPTPTIWPRS